MVLQGGFCKQRIQVEHCTSACRDEVTVAMALSGPRAQWMMVMQMNSKGHARQEGTTARTPNPEATHGGPQSAAATQQGCDTRKRSQRATVSFSPCLALGRRARLTRRQAGNSMPAREEEHQENSHGGQNSLAL